MAWLCPSQPNLAQGIVVLPTQHEEGRPVPQELETTGDGDVGLVGGIRGAAHCASHKPALPCFGLKGERDRQIFLRCSGGTWLGADSSPSSGFVQDTSTKTAEQAAGVRNKTTKLGWSNSAAGGMLALHMANLSSIHDIP